MDRRDFLHAVLGAFAMRFAPQLPARRVMVYDASRVTITFAGITMTCSDFSYEETRRKVRPIRAYANAYRATVGLVSRRERRPDPPVDPPGEHDE